jgi:perosamine synthetase
MTQNIAARIPIYAPTLGREEVEAVTRCLEPSRFTGNEPVAEFERAFAQAIGAPRAIAVANGTVALHLAMLACDIGPGDEVIVPALTFVASANAIAYTGATPVLVDVDPVTWQMTRDAASQSITPRTRAILAVHLYGHACDVAGLRALAQQHGLSLIEDCAEALGTTVDGRHVGLDADVATFSFYKNKTITTGEGGAVFTKRPEWHDRIVLLKGQGVPLDRRYWHEVLGYNYRMTNLSAALGTAQLKKLQSIIAGKRRLAQRYGTAFEGLPVVLQGEMPSSESTWWHVAATVPSPLIRDELADYLESCNVETRPVFLPLQRFPMYTGTAANTPNADRISACGLCLPSSPTLSDAEFARVAGAISQFFDERHQVKPSSNAPSPRIG